MTDPERQDGTAIRIERRFAAPAQAVFEAWTSAELLRRWYPPGADWDTPVAEVDVRVGGKLRLVMRRPDGQAFGGGGEYLEIRPPERLVFTWRWDEDEGNEEFRKCIGVDNSDFTQTGNARSRETPPQGGSQLRSISPPVRRRASPQSSNWTWCI